MSDRGQKIIDEAVEVHNHAVLLGQHYRALLEALAPYHAEAYQSGGEGAVFDVAGLAGSERVGAELIGLLVAIGLGPILVQARGRADQTRVLNFAEHFEQLVERQALSTASRGQPNTDPLSAYRAPGVKVHARQSGNVPPQGKAI